MDNAIGIFLFIGLIFVGFLIGYPFGHLFGKREAESRFFCEPADILDAEILEERRR